MSTQQDDWVIPSGGLSARHNNLCPLKVFVRVRPFMRRELESEKARSIIEMEGMQSSVITTAIPISESDTKRERFTFEKCFNGVMRGGKAIESESCGSEAARLADQSLVYAHVGLPVLQNVLDGYNGCVLAYGQTGSGKTFTMMGPPSVLGTGLSSRTPRSRYGDDFTNEDKKPLEGIIPRLVRDLFESLQRKHASDETHSFKLELEYYEIYKEKVLDLLGPTSEDPLRVRHNGEKGPYVEGLTRKQIASGKEVFKWIKRGNIERHTGTTRMNDRSSRSHAVLTLHLIQMKLNGENDGMGSCLRSKLHLVDLAGSERAAASGAVGLQLEEANKINTSLTTLGRVIDSLAQISQGKTGVFCPYRDSTLTWLLMDSIGGNSKTTLVATVSPHPINYEETTQTLRYASRAKQIVTKVSVNEDPQLLRIRQLTAEVQRLQTMIQNDGGKVDFVDQLSDRIRFLEEEVAEKDLIIAQLQAQLADAQTVVIPHIFPSPVKKTEKEKEERRRHKRSKSAHSDDSDDLKRELKKQETLVSSLRKDIKAYSRKEKELLSELDQYRTAKKHQIQRAVDNERDEWEGELAILKAKLKESNATIKKQSEEIEALKNQERDREKVDLNARIANAVKRVTRSPPSGSSSLSPSAAQLVEQLGLTASPAPSGTEFSVAQLTTMVNGLTEVVYETKKVNTALLDSHAADFRRHIETLEKREWSVLAKTARALIDTAKECARGTRRIGVYTRRSSDSRGNTPLQRASVPLSGRRKTQASPENRLINSGRQQAASGEPPLPSRRRVNRSPDLFVSPAYERYESMMRSGMRTASLPAKKSARTVSSPTPRAQSARTSKTPRKATPRDVVTPGRTLSARTSKASKNATPRDVVTPGRTLSARTSKASKNATPRGTSAVKKRGLAKSPGKGESSPLSSGSALALEQLKNEFNECRKHAEEQHMDDMKTIKELTGAITETRKQLEEERAQKTSSDASPNELRARLKEMEEKLYNSQRQVSVLRRISSARDRIYDEINKAGINPACFTDAILKIEAAARTQWEEEESLCRLNIVNQFRLHKHYNGIIHRIHSEKVLVAQSLMTETKRVDQIVKDFDTAQKENDALMKANQTVLKKVSYTKEQLDNERRKNAEAAVTIEALEEDLRCAKADSQRMQREWDALSDEKARLQEEKNQLSTTVAQLSERAAVEATELQRIVATQENQLAALHADYEQSLAHCTLLEEEKQSLEESRKREREELKNQQGELQSAVEELQHELAQAHSENEALIAANETVLKKIHYTKNMLRLESEKTQKVEGEVKALEEDLRCAKADNQRMQREWDALSDEKARLQEEKNRLNTTVAELSERAAVEATELQRIVATQENQLAALHADYEQSLAHCTLLEEEKQSLEESRKREREALEGEIKTLKDHRRELEVIVKELREDVRQKNAVIDEFQELKFMQDHLDHLEEQSGESGGSARGGGAFNRISSIIQSTLFKKPAADSAPAHQDGGKNKSFSNEDDLLGNSLSEPDISIHTMLSAKVECGTGFRKGMTAAQQPRRGRTPVTSSKRGASRPGGRDAAAEEPNPRAPLQARPANIVGDVAEKRSLSRGSSRRRLPSTSSAMGTQRSLSGRRADRVGSAVSKQK